MMNKVIRRVALGTTVAATALLGITAPANADGCVQIDQTISKTAPTGEGVVTRVCSIVNVLRPADPSTETGRGYQLDDGTILWLSEAEWWDLMDKAVEDPEWREANHDLLEAVGILECHFELVATIKAIEITERYVFCDPTWDPRERLDWPVVRVSDHWLGGDDDRPAPTGNDEWRVDPGL
jgi:hypothetical protein